MTRDQFMFDTVFDFDPDLPLTLTLTLSLDIVLISHEPMG